MWQVVLRRDDSPENASLGEHLSESECLLLSLAEAVEQRDQLTAGHCERVALISVALGIAMRLSETELLSLYRGGYLHDIGKVGIPDSLLFKSGTFTAEEWDVMCSHTVRGEEICRPLASLAPVLPIIRHHHERWDGSGYPDRLYGSQIPLLARVLQVADIYDALTSPRTYKRPLSPAQALQIIVAETGRGWRDPEITGLFLRLHANVISKLARYDVQADQSLRKMRMSMRNLRRFLATDHQVVA